MPSTFDRFKERKLVQWTVAYLAGAWLVVQLVDAFGARWGLSDALSRGIDVGLVAGLFATIVLAWYHGEKGRQRVSGPELLILATLFALTGLGVSMAVGRDDAAALDSVAIEGTAFDGLPSIAVLPFDHRSSLEEDRYFTDGTHDELLSALQRISGLKVISRTSVEAYRDTDKTVPTIGRELGVRYLLEGGVQRAGGRVRINVQLIDAATDDHIWSETYDRELSVEALLDVQTEIVETIAGRLSVTLQRDERARRARALTDDDEAYDLYMRASVSRDFDEVARLARAARERDPGFLDAYALESRAEAFIYQMRPDETPERRTAALEAAEAALSIDPSDPHAQLAMGNFLYRVDQEWDASLEWLERSRGTLAGDFLYLIIRGFAERRAGRWSDAVRTLYDAMALNPYESGTRAQLASTLAMMRRFDEAERQLELIEQFGSRFEGSVDFYAAISDVEMAIDGVPGPSTRELGRLNGSYGAYDALEQGEWAAAEAALLDAPEVMVTQFFWAPKGLFLGAALRGLGRDDEATEAFEEALGLLEARSIEVPEDPRVPITTGLVLGELGRGAEARAAIQRAFELQPVARDALEAQFFMYVRAVTELLLGNEPAALEELDQLLSRPSVYTPQRLERDARFASLWDDPDFTALMDRHRGVVFR